MSNEEPLSDDDITTTPAEGGVVGGDADGTDGGDADGIDGGDATAPTVVSDGTGRSTAATRTAPTATRPTPRTATRPDRFSTS